jgi:diguanylate cyclase (GGDEF)-like protein
MKIRSYLVFCLLVATLLPTLVFSLWSYRDAVTREFDEVKDRHLLLARRAALDLDRYRRDLATTFEAASISLSEAGNADAYSAHMESLNLCCVLLVDKTTGVVTRAAGTAGSGVIRQVPPALFSQLAAIARTDRPVFSDLMADDSGRNVIYLVRELAEHYAIGSISTDYFIDLGQSIVFGEKGHAAIVDRSGTIIAHPKPDWINARRNISGLSVVARMMNGETGIEEFHSPAVNKDMIAGFTTVPEAGWGVMVPQPVSEIYDKVARNQSSLLLIVAAALAATILIGLLLARSLSRPLEDLVRTVHTSAQNRKLARVEPRNDLIRFREIDDFRDSYDTMVERVTRAGEEIERLAYTDHVTGLPNRERLQVLATPILVEAQDPCRGGVVILIDLDNFKEINDLHGHHAGDIHLRSCARKLMEVAEGLTPAASDQDPPVARPIVARIGGDEFIMLVQGLVDTATVHRFLEDILTALAVPDPDLGVTPSASIGCARFPEDGTKLAELTKRADIAMYHAKRAGKNRTLIYSPAIGMQSAAETRRDLIAAIEQDRLFLEYQPKICTVRRKVISVEALVRWDHEDFGCLLPKNWIPLLGGSQAMNRLGEWVVDRAMRDHARLAELGHDLWMSVNIGANHFVSPGFVDTIESIRSARNFDSGQLEIEVTEDALFASEQRSVSTFARLHELGYKVSIDDFGTGYSNITRLASLPVDFLKIDHSLIAGACADERIRAILASTIEMAAKLGCKTVAEGVETRRQAKFVTELGADCLQGHYFAYSLPLDELLDWLDLQKTAAGHVLLRPETASA